MRSESDAVAQSAIRQAERALYDAMIKKDFAALDRILSADLVYVHSTGVVENKAQYLAAVGQDLYVYNGITSRGVAVKVFGDVAVMHGIVDMSVAGGGNKRVIHLQFVLTWVKQAAGWRLFLRHATRIPD